MTRSERKQIRRILRQALAGPLASPQRRPGAATAARARPADQTGIDAPAELLARLVADGLL